MEFPLKNFKLKTTFLYKVQLKFACAYCETTSNFFPIGLEDNFFYFVHKERPIRLENTVKTLCELKLKLVKNSTYAKYDQKRSFLTFLCHSVFSVIFGRNFKTPAQVQFLTEFDKSTSSDKDCQSEIKNLGPTLLHI